MFSLSQLVYNLALQLYRLGIFCAAFFSPKAKKWIVGRKNIPLKHSCPNCIWVHCASVGEFEQARPLIEAIKQIAPQEKILLTFFSPSGFEAKKHYEFADVVTYLPLDTKANAVSWIKTHQPKLVLWIKYEFWYHFVTQLHQANIPTLLISAHFHKNQRYFKWYGALFRQVLNSFSHLFVQSQASCNLLNQIGIEQVSVVSDTRFDRVHTIAQQPTHIKEIEAFKGNSKLLVAGSTWAKDEKLLLNFLQNAPKNIKLLLVPHEVNAQHLLNLKMRIDRPCCYYSSFELEKAQNSQLMVLDTMGLLASSYQYADWAYIGGGFGAGIHNILEAAIYNIPLFFGPNNERFREAQQLLKLAVAFEVNNALSLNNHLTDLNNPRKLAFIQEKTINYFEKNLGATDKILAFIKSQKYL